MLGQELPVDPGLDVKALGEAAGHQIAQIPVSHVVFAQQYQVGIGAVDAVVLVEAGAGGHIDLAADDGADALGGAGAVKGHRAVHDAVVRHRQGGLSQLFGPLCQILDAAGAVQQGVFRMHMQMDEGHFRLL